MQNIIKHLFVASYSLVYLCNLAMFLKQPITI